MKLNRQFRLLNKQSIGTNYSPSQQVNLVAENGLGEERGDEVGIRMLHTILETSEVTNGIFYVFETSEKPEKPLQLENAST